MSIIELNQGNCQNCYKCIRHCPIKAIQFKDSRATVIEEECILCGTCVDTCPQNAKFVKSQRGDVKKLLDAGERVYVTVAPSFSAYYGVDFPILSATLKQMGFAGVEETAIGANEVSLEYSRLLEEGKMKNIIVTACSSVVMLVERHYPELIPYLAPVASPMMAHAKLMREAYGDDIKVVFLGPCIAKKEEASDPLAGGYVDYAITFSGLEEWMDSIGMSFSETPDPEAVGVVNPVSRLYPKPFGIIDTIDKQLFQQQYRRISVDGIDNCTELFDSLKNDPTISGLFIEANVCKGGCLGGPVMRAKHKNPFLMQFKISDEKKDFDRTPAVTAQNSCAHPRVFSNRIVSKGLPSEEEIRRILATTGKYTKEDELNCGGCGYSSCREKAIAVYQGKADIHMCLPYFRQQAENMSNTVIAYSPNAIMVFDRDQQLLDLNPTAETMFGITKNEWQGEIPPIFYGETDFDTAKETGKVQVKTVQIEDKFCEQTILYIKEHHMYLAFLKDISEEEQRKQEIASMRNHTVMVAQKVIEKQMTVAQEIASLLGETTAETKVALTKLKKSMEEQNK
jgi:PAS domain S-box-containing protein